METGEFNHYVYLEAISHGIVLPDHLLSALYIVYDQLFRLV